MLLSSSTVSVPLSSEPVTCRSQQVHFTPQCQDLKLSSDLQYHLLHMVAGLESQARLHLSTPNSFIESDDNDDDDEFRFNDASIHEGHLRQNGILT